MVTTAEFAIFFSNFSKFDQIVADEPSLSEIDHVIIGIKKASSGEVQYRTPNR
jgi:hypothetical protein